MTRVWEGATPSSPPEQGTWVLGVDEDTGEPAPDSFPWLDDGVWADFTVVGTTGSGNQPPVADAGGSYEGAVDIDVTFNGGLSYDPDGFVDTLDWEFGDGASASGPVVTHAYSVAGPYNVTLTVTDDDGAPSSDHTTATIGDNPLPVADANGDYTGTVDVAVVFDGTGSFDNEGPIVSYDWDYGDGTATDFNAGPTPSHTYTAAGDYPVALTVTDDNGGTDTDTATAQIAAGNQPPVANANGPYFGSVIEAVNFDGTASNDPDGTVDNYVWAFGDGQFGPTVRISDQSMSPSSSMARAPTTRTGRSNPTTGTTVMALRPISMPGQLRVTPTPRPVSTP